MTHNLKLATKTSAAALLGLCAAFASVNAVAQSKPIKNNKKLAPASKFDMSHWNITLPVDQNGDGKVDSVKVKELQKYSHPDFFYLDENDHMVFVAPNRGAKTKNTTNVRSELRYMLRGTKTKYKTHGPENNFAMLAQPQSDKFGSVGGKMEATLRVDHVALNAGNSSTKAAHSVVVGQIHAVKYKDHRSGFGYGNEPLKIYYKKFPGHDKGSVFWNYERNLAKDDPNRKDISYPVWGNTWENQSDPGAAGVALGEDFSYTVNVHKNTMHLTFESPTKKTVKYSIALVNNVDAYGNVDELDNKYSYGGDSMYFKAGVYNQCSTKKGGGTWYAGCDGTGKWDVDKANGDYAQATFSRLVVGDSVPNQ